MLHLAKKFFRWHTDVDSSFFSGAHVVGLPACRNTSLRNTFFPLTPLHLWSIAPSHVFHYRTEPTSVSKVFLGLILLLPPSNVSWDLWYSQSHHSLLLALVQKRAVGIFRLLCWICCAFTSVDPPVHAFASISTCDFSGEHEGIG